MGSIDNSIISGFLCRLCSEMHRVVIHVYGDQGLKLKLVDKINGYLPITISPNDHLPKTICQPCLQRVEQHYDLLLKLRHFGKNRFEINLKKITNPNADNANTDATAIGVNSDQFDPRPQIRSWLLNSTTYSSSESLSSIHSSDSFDSDYDINEILREVQNNRRQRSTISNSNCNTISENNSNATPITSSDSNSSVHRSDSEINEIPNETNTTTTTTNNQNSDCTNSNNNNNNSNENPNKNDKTNGGNKKTEQTASSAQEDNNYFDVSNNFNMIIQSQGSITLNRNNQERIPEIDEDMRCIENDAT